MVHGLQLTAGQSGDQVEVCGASDAGEGDISSSKGDVGTVDPEKGLLDHGTLGFTDRHRIGWAEGKSGSVLSVFTDGGNRVREDHATIGQAQDDCVVLAIYNGCSLAIEKTGPLVAVLCDHNLHLPIYLEVVRGAVTEDP